MYSKIAVMNISLAKSGAFWPQFLGKKGVENKQSEFRTRLMNNLQKRNNASHYHKYGT